TRAVEALARVHGKLAPLTPELQETLRGVVTERRHTYPAGARVNAMAALIASGGADAETLRVAAAARLAGLRRLAAVVLGGAGSVVVSAERTSLLTTLLGDSSAVV